MSTRLDRILLPKVLAVVNELGIDATFAVPGSSSYDPETRKNTITGTANVVRKVTPPEGFAFNLVNGDNIRVGDKLINLPAKDLTFDPNTTGIVVTIDGLDYKIMGVRSVYSGTDICLYEIHLRR